jgi:predicted AlkP superfamily pyrophosphatase or phosphodiesterase
LTFGDFRSEGFCRPDYDGGSIVSLLSSIIRSLGGSSPHPELNTVDPGLFRGAVKIIYLVLDGVGYNQLQRFISEGGGDHFFGKHPCVRITSVFPPTTAAAITSVSTGATPTEHALVSWYLQLPDLGMVSAILPGTTRTGTPMVMPDFDLRRYLALPSYLSSVSGHKRQLAYGRLGQSRYSNAGTRWDQCASYTTLRGLAGQACKFARHTTRGVAYAYWPKYDTLCHMRGCDHRETRSHLGEIDRALSNVLEGLRGTDTLLCVTADHGVVDAPPHRLVDLSKVPGFLDCLAVLPSGDGRQASCFVRASQVRRFHDVVAAHLSQACVCIAGDELLESGLLGPGRPHKALASRIGDFVLIARGDYAFLSSVPFLPVKKHKGNHGGLSADEIFVPLYALRC